MWVLLSEVNIRFMMSALSSSDTSVFLSRSFNIACRPRMLFILARTCSLIASLLFVDFEVGSGIFTKIITPNDVAFTKSTYLGHN